MIRWQPLYTLKIKVMKELEKKLEQKKVRPTAMRLLVLEVLQNQKAAISLQDLELTFEKADRITLSYPEEISKERIDS